MKIELNELIYVDGIAVAAIVKRLVQGYHYDHFLSACGAKQPVAVLIRHCGKTVAFGVDGLPIGLDQLERRYPDQCAAFDRMVDERGTAS